MTIGGGITKTRRGVDQTMVGTTATGHERKTRIGTEKKIGTGETAVEGLRGSTKIINRRSSRHF